jgi:uncharacterized protein (UPF0332 family)
MKMNYERLEKDGFVERISCSREEIRALLEIANRDISAAEYIMTHDIDWALTIAYNSVHQILLAIMYKEGFRPKGEAKHKVAIDFCRIALGNEYKTDIDIIDKMRKKRNRAVYQHARTVSELEAKEGIIFANGFVTKILKEKLTSF